MEKVRPAVVGQRAGTELENQISRSFRHCVR
jgi:hypothetical protein